MSMGPGEEAAVEEAIGKEEIRTIVKISMIQMKKETIDLKTKGKPRILKGGIDLITVNRRMKRKGS